MVVVFEEARALIENPLQLILAQANETRVGTITTTDTTTCITASIIPTITTTTITIMGD
jgi:hypothetical protein